jgi:hypothetical protein
MNTGRYKLWRTTKSLSVIGGGHQGSLRMAESPAVQSGVTGRTANIRPVAAVIDALFGQPQRDPFGH